MKNISNDLNYSHGDLVHQLSYLKTNNARSVAISETIAENSMPKTKRKQLVQVKNYSLCEDDYWKNGILGERLWKTVCSVKNGQEQMREMVKLKKSLRNGLKKWLRRRKRLFLIRRKVCRLSQVLHDGRIHIFCD